MSGKKMMDAERLEDISLRLHCACALLDVVHCAVAENPGTNTTDALYSVLETLQHIQQDFETEFQNAAET